MTKNIIARHKFYWMQKPFLYSAVIGIILFTGSLLVNYLANIYAVKMASNSVTDLVLSVLPKVNTDFIFVEGFGVFILCVIVLMIRDPKTLPFILKSMAFFIFVRSVFMILTHMGPLSDRTIVDNSVIERVLTSGADLFFSAHTGLPFLLALIFWEQFYARIIFLTFSFVAGVSVLLAHLHYSIDVAGAFFITHSIFIIAQRLFNKDCELFKQGLAGEKI